MSAAINQSVTQRQLRVLWICSLPLAVQQLALAGENHGAQVAMSWILAHLPPPSGIELHIACLWPGGTQRKTAEFAGVPFHLVPCPRKGRSLFLFQRDSSLFRELFRELQPDVVHGWGTEDSFGLVARRLAPSRHVIGVQGLMAAIRGRVRLDRRSTFTALTERLTLRAARWVVAESDYARRVSRPLCPRARMRVIEHPLRREFLEAAPATGTANRAIFIGNICDRKGIYEALRAFAFGAPKDWFLHIIGTGAPAAETQMTDLLKELGLGARFRHERSLATPELIAAMRECSIFLLPTWIDTGPTALKEALALALWPVCYDNSGPGEYVPKLGFGSLARDLDVDDLTRTLRAAIETRPWTDTSLRQRLYTATRKTFAPTEIWPQLASLYAEISQGDRID